MSQHRFVSFVLCLAILVSNFSTLYAQVKSAPDAYRGDSRRDKSIIAHIADVRTATLRDLYASQLEIGPTESQRVIAWFDSNNASVASALDKAYQSEAGKRLANYMKDADRKSVV